MDIIKFIEEDIQRNKQTPGYKKYVIIIGTALLPVLLGIFLRDDLNGVFDPRNFFSNLVAALLLLSIPTLYEKRSAYGKIILSIMLISLALSIFFATERMFFPGSNRTSYVSEAIFWHESKQCFIKGTFASLIMGVWLTIFAFKLSSWPSRRFRLVLSFTAGISGTVMLGFHCDSSSVAHVLTSHLGQGLITGLLVWVVQELIFFSKIHKLFSKLYRWYKLG